jgi:hypothetical protein
MDELRTYAARHAAGFGDCRAARPLLFLSGAPCLPGDLRMCLRVYPGDR